MLHKKKRCFCKCRVELISIIEMVNLVEQAKSLALVVAGKPQLLFQP